MKEITFSSRTYNGTFGFSEASGGFEVSKPMVCPVCGAFEDGIQKDKHLFIRSKSSQIGTVLYECAYCRKRYLTIHDIDRANQKSTFNGFVPEVTLSYENDLLAELSPKFIDGYNQALRAESRGDVELAAIGFRHALECLVKDYAITELGENKDTVVNKTLYSAIGDYLPDAGFVSTADVIRILGNDYTHYERKYPEHDFTLLKQYMDIFVKLIETKMLIKHPPVSR